MKDYSLIKFVKSDEILEEYFLHSFERKVSTDSTIQVLGKTFEVPGIYMKQKITVKFNPHDLDVAYIYQNGQKAETIHPVNKIDNSKMKRNSLSFNRMEGINND